MSKQALIMVLTYASCILASCSDDNSDKKSQNNTPITVPENQDDKSCHPESFKSSCKDQKTRLICENNDITPKPCASNELCRGGECHAMDACNPATFEPNCKDQNTRFICESNTITTTPCKTTETCVKGACVPKEECDSAKFKPFCKDNKQLTICEANRLKDTPCPDNQICKDDECQPEPTHSQTEPTSCEDKSFFNKCIDNAYYICPFGSPLKMDCQTRTCMDSNGMPDCYSICDPAADNTDVLTCVGDRVEKQSCVKSSAGDFYAWSSSYTSCQYGCDESTNTCIELELCDQYTKSSCSNGKLLTCEYDPYRYIFYYKSTECEDNQTCGYNKTLTGYPPNDYNPECIDKCQPTEVGQTKYNYPNSNTISVSTCVEDDGNYYWQSDYTKDIYCSHGYDSKTNTCIKLAPNEGEHCEESFDEQCTTATDGTAVHLYCSVVYGNPSQNTIIASPCDKCIDTDGYTGCIYTCEPGSSETYWSCQYEIDPSNSLHLFTNPHLKADSHCSLYEDGYYVLPAIQSCPNGCREYSDHCYITAWNEGNECNPETFTSRCEADADGQEYHIYCNGKIVAEPCNCSEDTEICTDNSFNKTMKYSAIYSAYCQHLVDSECITDYVLCQDETIHKASRMYNYDYEELDDYVSFLGYKAKLPCGECSESDLGTYSDLTSCTEAYNAANAIKQRAIYGEMY